MPALFRFVVIVGSLLAGSSSAIGGEPSSFHFENQIEPIFARHGCNSSGCHGKAEGQGGFKLSVFGYDPKADFDAVVKDARGRRVMPASAEESLLLRKASGRVPHGGGTRLKPDHKDYATLRSWIVAGMMVGDPNAPKLMSIRIEPTERVMEMRSELPLRVFATYADGREAEVTDHARYQSNSESLAVVSASGVVSTQESPGEVAVMAAYLGEMAVFRAMVPRPGTVAASTLPQFNFIDQFIDEKLAKLNIAASPLCDDAEYLRRVSLDLTGTLPKPDEARKFLSDSSLNKRALLVESLLARHEFADLMALKWADLLRVDRQSLGHEKAYAYYRWLRDSFAANKPFDQFARELVTAEGPLDEVGPANFYKVVTKPGEMANTLSQVFLGVRIACAECHHHPSDRWSQTDYAGMVGFFTPVSIRGGKGGEWLSAQGNPNTKHPRSGEPVVVHALGETPPAENPVGERRGLLADWMTKPSNPYFARNFANRIWAHLLGRGIVEPVDDVRATNPPSHPELLTALAKFAVDSKYDTKAMVRLICASRVYQSSSATNETNAKDEQNFSRAAFKRPDAEVLLDMISQASGVPEKFRGAPQGTRAIQLWDSRTNHEFLKLFGRPLRLSACECERNSEPSSAQILNLLNSPDLQAKLAHENGTVAKLCRTIVSDSQLVDELYLTFFSRVPTPKERDTATTYLNKNAANRRHATEDLAWAMLNTLEFLFNH